MRLFNNLFFNKELDDTKTEERLLYFGAKDSVFSSRIALPIIMIFELYMIVNWFLNYRKEITPATIGYLVGYAALLALSAALLVYILSVEKDLEHHYRSILLLQYIYCVFFIIWSLTFTYIGGIYRDNFSIIIYVTVLTIIPVFCFCSPIFSFIAEGLSAVFVISIAIRCEPHLRSFMINFIVFSIISMVAAIALYYTRCRSYIRQIELEKMSEENYRLAFMDGLTGLRNRRSYMDRISAIAADSTGESRKNLVLLSVDVNGLKMANDTKGHEAGDELLIATGEVLQKTFSAYGTVYRIGGDEFSAILQITPDNLAAVKSAFERNMNEWHGQYSGTLSVSSGYALAEDLPEASLKQLATAADEDMYADKKAYYQRTGFERRG